MSRGTKRGGRRRECQIQSGLSCMTFFLSHLVTVGRGRVSPSPPGAVHTPTLIVPAVFRTGAQKVGNLDLE